MTDINPIGNYIGQNMAPLKPLLALKERNGDKSPNSSHYLTDALKEKYTGLLKTNEKARKEMIAAGQLVALFIEGKQILDWNPFTNAYSPRTPRKSDPNKIKAVNFMQYYCSNWQSKWRSSDPDIIVRAMSNQDQAVSKARKANAIVDYLEYKMYTRWYNLHEGLMAQVFGWYGNQVMPDYKKGVQVLKQIFETKEVQIGQGFGKCYDCEKTGPSAAFNQLQANDGDSDEGSMPPMPVCLNCGSTAVYHEPPPTTQIQYAAGYQATTQPNIKAEQLAFPACAWDYRYRMEESSWAIIEQDMSWGAIRSIIGDVILPAGESPNDFGLEVVANLSATGAPVGGKSSAPKGDRSNSGVISRMYLSPDEMFDIEIKGEQNGGEKTVSGQVLPFGARMSDLFPNGACVLGINGMATILSITADHHSQSVTSGVYHMKPLSGTGRGVTDAVEVQKRFNRFDSQAVRYMGTMATPATLWAEGAVPDNQKHLLSEPGADIPIRLQDFPEVRSVKDLMFPIQGQSVPGDMLQYTYQHLSNFMQLAYHITDFSGGLNPRVRNDTATGAEILDQNASELFSPALDIKADVRLDTAVKAFALWCQTNPEKRFIASTPSGRTGSRGIEVSAEDVKGEYEWSIAAGSEQPRNRLTKRKDAMAFYGLFGGILGYIQAKQMAPQEVADAERTWDMDFATEVVDEIAEVCRSRYESAKTLLGQAAQIRDLASMQYGPQSVPPPDLMQIISQVKPSMLIGEPAHQDKMKWFAELLDTDEGQAMSDTERELVQAFIQAEGMLAKGQAIVVGQAVSEAQIASNAPQMALQAAQSQQNQQAQAAQSAQQQQQSDQAAQAQGAQAVLQTIHEQGMQKGTEAENERQRQHELALKKLDVAAQSDKAKRSPAATGV